MNIAPAAAAPTSPAATPTAPLRAADGDYKTKGIGHEVKDADGDYKPTNVAPPASAAGSSSNNVRAALALLPKGGA